MQRRQMIQRILYRSVYILFYLILIGLLLITPGDVIQRSITNRTRYNILVLALVYAATLLIIAFVYATRLYVNTTSLSAIPKSWIPVDRGDVAARVHRLIGAGLQRSAAITFLSRPRDRSVADDDAARENLFAQPRVPLKTARTVALELGVVLPARGTAWADIEQPGWASPDSRDLPGLQYSTVLAELPNLIEAKALTLAPPQMQQEAAALLQRDPTSSLRTYVDALTELGVVDVDGQTGAFLAQYEYARFSTRPLTNSEFRSLMHLFAELLRTMRPPNIGDDTPRRRPAESAHDSDAPLESRPTTPCTRSVRSNDSSSSSSNGAARPPARLPLPRRDSSFHAWSQYATAPNTPGSRHTETALSRRRSSNSSSSLATVATTTRRGAPLSRLQQGPLRLRPQQSDASLRSSGSASSRSVIRLATTREDASALPYVLSLRPTMDQ
ncbi:thermatolerance membrane [Cordyceps militaris]|uniref:Defect at low temperature protein 1 n=1 Tax=Cordyceps militaris TaxID=73501 RepID=A0A2H4SAL6_CORMI|nr:thermatolerance membrane [Cordyceps militaris]